MSLRARALALMASLLLGACASRPPAPIQPAGPPGSPATRPPSAGAPATPAAPAAPESARRGGFYLDDGPGSGPPVDPASVPDAVPRPEPLHPRANRPYVVFERQYVPMTRLEPFSERGLATWYGRRYHGQRTSSGEPYDMYAMTAAHPTLPIPSYAQVTHLRNGRQVVVRVNDRGPFLHGRVIDLSWVAAARLGYVQAGSAEVEVVLIDDPAVWASRGSTAALAEAPTSTSTPTPTPTPTLRLEPVSARTSDALPTPGIWLQIGVFLQQDRALAVRDRGAAALGAVAPGVLAHPAEGRWRVLAGPWRSRADALAAGERLRESTGLQAIPITVGP